MRTIDCTYTVKKTSVYLLVGDTFIGISHSTETIQKEATLYEQSHAALQYGPVRGRQEDLSLEGFGLFSAYRQRFAFRTGTAIF